MSQKPFVSIILCTYRYNENLRLCLDSILNQNYPKNRYEIIVVVDENIDAYNVIQEYPVKCIFRKKRSGLSSARNVGVQNSKGEIIAFTDDDCVADKDWIDELISCFDEEVVGGVGGIVKPFFDDVNSRVLGLMDIIAPTYSRLGDVNEIHTRIAGANSAYRRKAIEEIGGWDENILYGADDVDINFRLKKKYKIIMNPRAIIHHKHLQNFKDIFRWTYNLSLGFAYVMKKNKLYLRGIKIAIPLLLTIFGMLFSYLFIDNFGYESFVLLMVVTFLAYLIVISYRAKKREIRIDCRLFIYTALILFIISFAGTLGRIKGFTKSY